MSAEETASIVRRYYGLLDWGADPTSIELIAVDAVFHEPGRLLQGREALRDRIAVFRTALPDLRCTIHDIVVADDKAAVRWSITGTHHGTFGPYPPSGKRVTMSGMAIHRVASGQMVEGWGCFDTLGVAQQLGATVSLPEFAVTEC
jgi:steroid delta-isomerase-like uncharacterized protein